MNIELLKSKLNTKIFGQGITFFNQTDSTNAQARIHCDKGGFDEGHIFVAAQQTQGKGTDDNTWLSGNDNLSLSIIFNFDQKVDTLFPLYPAVALAKVLKEQYQIEAHVKWPNDVLVGHEKIAGILCEGVAAQYMIVGIGVNVNQSIFPKELASIATSIKRITGQDSVIEELLASFLKEYENLLYNTNDIRQEWLQHTRMVGKRVSVTQDGETKKVKVIGISKEGFLQIENSQGMIENWSARRGLDINAEY
jgi:BirA family biotin operon repressor/biotin-[acetyl-CoA-carboxylase] ligase